MTYKKYLNFIILILGTFYSNISKSENSINFIDINFLLNNSLAGKSIVVQLKEINTTTQKNLKKIEDELKSKEAELNSQKNILSKEEFKKKMQIFAKEVSEYNITRNKLINENLKKKNEAQKILLNSLTEILTEYTEKNSISYVIPKQNIVLGKAELDITNIILKILNTEIKKIKVK